ncbi:hypothetical protein DFP73DRAFT_608658 [Morchella snyderi]|nr:hypothetical protein DFP73DRAFT_608658 [Morchella snyderi]
MEFNVILTLRIIQALLAIIVLGISAYVIDVFSPITIDSANFLLFNVCALPSLIHPIASAVRAKSVRRASSSIWSFVALGYLVATPMFFPNFHNRWGVLGVEAITMVFWFAGFIALAADIPTFRCAIGFRLAWLGTLGMVVNALIKHRKIDPGTDGNETGITDPTGAPDGATVLPSGTDVEMNGGPQFEKYEQLQQQPSEAPHLPQLSELGTSDEGYENRIYGHPPIDGSGTLEMPDVGQYGGSVTHVEQER